MLYISGPSPKSQRSRNPHIEITEPNPLQNYAVQWFLGLINRYIQNTVSI